MRKFLILFSLTGIIFISCSKPGIKKIVPEIGFLDAFQDETIDQARVGFLDALKENGFDDRKGSLKVLYKNAQGSPATLNLALSYLLHQPLNLLATNTTLPTIAAIKRTSTLPVIMMVSASPEMAGLLDQNGKPPANLAGVYEDLGYIDTSASLVHLLLPRIKKMGVIYSQGEAQSLNALNQLRKECKNAGIGLEVLPVNNSAETQLVVQALVHRHIEAFFALPDNSVFASFESILQTCNNAGIPIFTSEEGLVKRGALAAFGADIYQWGHQAGVQAAIYLKEGRTAEFTPERVLIRRKVINLTVAQKFSIEIPAGFVKLTSGDSGHAVPVQQSSLSGYYGDALMLGLGLTALAFGIYLSLKIFNVPDITTDGSYTLGAAITGVMLQHGLNSWYALLLAFIGGAIAGSVTGLITTKLRVNALLSGILVMTALYSVNISLMGRSNISISSSSSIYSSLTAVSPGYRILIFLLLIIAVLWLALTWILKTDFGLAMRATGSSETMIRSMGVNTDRMKITGLALSNGLVGVSGFLISQFQGFADINMGIGIVITGLGSVMIGETLLDMLGISQVAIRLGGVILGAIIFQLLLAVSLAAGIDVNLLRLCTAVLVLLVVSIPGLKTQFR